MNMENFKYACRQKNGQKEKRSDMDLSLTFQFLAKYTYIFVTYRPDWPPLSQLDVDFLKTVSADLSVPPAERALAGLTLGGCQET